jgi:hypothetical protein
VRLGATHAWRGFAQAKPSVQRARTRSGVRSVLQPVSQGFAEGHGSGALRSSTWPLVRYRQPMKPWAVAFRNANQAT